MISSHKAKRKAQALEKYQREQFVRRGGHACTAVSVASAAASLHLAHRFFGIRSIPYLATAALGGYLGGTRIGALTVGKSTYHDTYTLEEYHLLKEQLFAHQLKDLQVESADDSGAALKQAAKELERMDELEMAQDIR